MLAWWMLGKAKEGKRHLDSRKKTTSMKIIMKYGRTSEQRDGGK